MKGRSALRRGPTPATAERKREVGGGGRKEMSLGEGEVGGKAEGNRLEEARFPPGCEPGCRERAPVTLGHGGVKGQPVCREEGGQRQGPLQVLPGEGDGQTEGPEASPGPKGVASRHPIDRREMLGQRAATPLSPGRPGPNEGPRGPRVAADPPSFTPQCSYLHTCPICSRWMTDCQIHTERRHRRCAPGVAEPPAPGPPRAAPWP